MPDMFSILMIIVIIAVVIGIMVLYYMLTRQNKTLMEKIIGLLPVIGDSLNDYIVDGEIDTPAEKVFTICKSVAEVVVDYVENLSKKESMTSEEKLEAAKDTFYKTCKSMKLDLTDFQETVAIAFIESAVKRMNDSIKK